MTKAEIRVAAAEIADQTAVHTQMRFIAGTLTAFSLLLVIATVMSALA
jgi:hypothetical protein